jgi:putative endopeptidase
MPGTRDQFLGVPVSSTVRAVDDMDAFVNEAWKASNPIPGDQSTWGVLHKLSDRVIAECREITEDPA